MCENLYVCYQECPIRIFHERVRESSKCGDKSSAALRLFHVANGVGEEICWTKVSSSMFKIALMRRSSEDNPFVGSNGVMLQQLQCDMFNLVELYQPT